MISQATRDEIIRDTLAEREILVREILDDKHEETRARKIQELAMCNTLLRKMGYFPKGV
jgi:hypothetical protein